MGQHSALHITHRLFSMDSPQTIRLISTDCRTSIIYSLHPECDMISWSNSNKLSFSPRFTEISTKLGHLNSPLKLFTATPKEPWRRTATSGSAPCSSTSPGPPRWRSALPRRSSGPSSAWVFWDRWKHQNMDGSMVDVGQADPKWLEFLGCCASCECRAYSPRICPCDQTLFYRLRVPELRKSTFSSIVKGCLVSVQ